MVRTETPFRSQGQVSVAGRVGLLPAANETFPQLLPFASRRVSATRALAACLSWALVLVPGQVCFGSVTPQAQTSLGLPAQGWGSKHEARTLGLGHKTMPARLGKGDIGLSWGVGIPSPAGRTLEHLAPCHDHPSSTHNLAFHLSCVPDVCHLPREACPVALELSNA